MEIGQNIYMYWTVAVTLLCTSLTLVSPGTRALVIPSGRGQEVKSTSITRIKEMGSARGDVRHNVYSRRRRSVTDDEMNTLLKEHNDKRRLEGAANMEFMVGYIGLPHCILVYLSICMSVCLSVHVCIGVWERFC